MTKDEAEETARLIADRYGDVHAFAVDPRAAMTWGMDRWTAEAVRDGLSRLHALGGDVANLLEQIEEFLAIAYPYAEGEERWPGVQ